MYKFLALKLMFCFFSKEGEACVLVSAGIELIVFPVAGMVLCFEFSMRRMLVTLMFSVVAK